MLLIANLLKIVKLVNWEEVAFEYGRMKSLITIFSELDLSEFLREKQKQWWFD